MSLAPSIRRLIEESADVLERIGSDPIHRRGTAALYGRHLREVVGFSPRRVSFAECRQQRPAFPIVQNTQIQAPVQTYQTPPDLAPMQMSELLQFSAMSDDQINEAINNAGAELETYVPELQMDDKAGLDWLDWFNLDVNMGYENRVL